MTAKVIRRLAGIGIARVLAIGLIANVFTQWTTNERVTLVMHSAPSTGNKLTLREIVGLLLDLLGFGAVVALVFLDPGKEPRFS